MLPTMTIFAPGDPLETRLATRAMMKHRGPCYLRLGKAGEPVIHEKKPHFAIGKGIEMSLGKDVLLIATSTMLGPSWEAKKILEEKGMSVAFVSMPCIKPLDESLIKKYAEKVPYILTIEEHSVIGGLGSAVSECLSEYGYTGKLKRIGVPDHFTKEMGNQEYMRKKNGIAVSDIVSSIQELWGKKR
jgi:transketolase